LAHYNANYFRRSFGAYKRKYCIVGQAYLSATHWFLAGGGVQRNENLLEAARREAKEEVGASLGELKLLGVYTNYFDYKSDHVVVFVCDDFTLSGVSDNEIEKMEFFHATPANCAGLTQTVRQFIIKARYETVSISSFSIRTSQSRVSRSLHGKSQGVASPVRNKAGRYTIRTNLRSHERKCHKSTLGFATWKQRYVTHMDS